MTGFLTFMPYAGFPIGARTAVQVGTVVHLLVFAHFFFSIRKLGVQWTSLLLMAPVLLSTLRIGFTPDGDLPLAAKTFPVWCISLLAMASTQLAAPAYMLEILTGTAIATLVHCGVGLWQLYAFSHGAPLPLVWLYVNQSFLSVQDNAEIIAKYTQRPFGIFPEPSAMSSSLAPVVLLWLGDLCGLLRFHRPPRRWQRLLFAAAVAAALVLIIISRSGHAAITMAGVALFVGIWFIRAKATPASVAAILAVFGLVLPIAFYFAAESLGDRLGGKSDLGNSSWEDRTNSLIIGFRLLTEGDVWTLVFGYGPGHMSAMLDRIARLEAVWSVTLTYIYETGVIGAMAVTWIGIFLLRIWKADRYNVAYIVIVLVWFVGITITTSYVELLTMWMTLGWLTVWPSICELAPARSARPTGTVQPATVRRVTRPASPRWAARGWRDVNFAALDAAALQAPAAAAPVKRWTQPPSERWSER